MGHVGGNSYGWGASTGLAPKDCLFYIGPDPGGAGSVKRLLGELTLKIHSSQNSQGLPHTSSKKDMAKTSDRLQCLPHFIDCSFLVSDLICYLLI